MIVSTAPTTSPTVSKIPVSCGGNKAQQPLGMRLDKGKYVITEPLYHSARSDQSGGSIWRGVRTTDGAKVIVSVVASKLEHDLRILRDNLALEIGGIAPLLYIGPLEYGDQAVEKSVAAPAYDAMVELEPDGVPLSTLLPDKISSLSTLFKLKLVFDCAVRVVEAQEMRQTMSGALRPEYIYVNPNASEASDFFNGLVPRAELFFGSTVTSATDADGWPTLFDHIYSPMESSSPSADEKKENDAYNLIAILVCAMTGESPFPGDDGLAQQEACARGELRHDYEEVFEAVASNYTVHESIVRLMKEGMHQWITASTADNGAALMAPLAVQDMLWVLLTAMAAAPKEEKKVLSSSTEDGVFEI